MTSFGRALGEHLARTSPLPEVQLMIWEVNGLKALWRVGGARDLVLTNQLGDPLIFFQQPCCLF